MAAIKYMCFLLFFLTISKEGSAINLSDSLSKKSSFAFQSGAGGSFYPDIPAVPKHLQTTVNRLSYASTVRFIWMPGYRLNVGVETGYLHLYNYKIENSSTTGSLYITSVPLLVEFSMYLTKRLTVFAGAGSFFETTHLRYKGETRSEVLNTGWISAITYHIVRGKNIGIFSEFKWMNATEEEHGVFTLQLLLEWKFIKEQK
jgi:hypothetical protein